MASAGGQTPLASLGPGPQSSPPASVVEVPPGHLLGFFTHNVLLKNRGAMIFDPIRGVSLWARRQDFNNLPKGAIATPSLLQFAPVSYQVIRRNNQDWAANVSLIHGFVPALTLAGELSPSQGSFSVTPCSAQRLKLLCPHLR